MTPSGTVQPSGALKPADPKVTDGAISLAARGRFDTKSGELSLTPPEGAKLEPIALASEGLKVTGLGKGERIYAVRYFGDLAPNTVRVSIDADRVLPHPHDVADRNNEQPSCRDLGAGTVHLVLRLDVPDDRVDAEGDEREKQGGSWATTFHGIPLLQTYRDTPAY